MTLSSNQIKGARYMCGITDGVNPDHLAEAVFAGLSTIKKLKI